MTHHPQTPPPPPPMTLISWAAANTAILLLIGTTLINIGMTRQKFDEVIKNQEVSSTELKIQAARLTEFREKQIGGLRDIEVLKTTVQGIDNRVLVIERTFIEMPPKRRTQQ